MLHEWSPSYKIASYEAKGNSVAERSIMKAAFSCRKSSLLPSSSMAAALTALHLTLILCLSTPILTSSEDPNRFVYNGFREGNLKLDVNTKVHPDGLLQLTNTSKPEMGHAFYSYPVTFSNSSLSFSTNFVFAMVPELQDLGGHGLAFTISPSTDFSKAVPNQYLGLFNTTNNGLSSNHIFAVELDSIRNPEFGDINDNHVGVNLNGLKSIDSAPVTYFSEKERKHETLQLINGNPIQIWIDYNQNEKLLNVTLTPYRNPKPSKPLLSTSIDLSFVFFESMYVGFSSATVASKHYILGWSFSRSGEAQNLEISKLPLPPKQRKSTKKPNLEVLILLIIISIAILTIGGVYMIRRRKKYEEIREDWETKYGPHRFSFKELYKATKGFNEKEVIGLGGFGKVYKGTLPSSNAQVAIKRISHDSNQGMKEFVAEIATMGRLRHRNLVQLQGYCRRRGELLLVYDYMPNGSLDNFLFGVGKPSLNWIQRYQIIKGVASGLLYLHEDWEQVVLHRDMKASNVLLDSSLNARLGDFGLARLHDHGSHPQTTRLVGTVGYLAPELIRTGKATTSTDVFAFGAFMLETVCGRRPVEVQAFTDEIVLAELVFQSWKIGKVVEAVDPKLEGNYIVEEAELVLRLRLLCSQRKPMTRPSMRQVVQYLSGDAILPDLTLEGTSIGLSDTSDARSIGFISSFPPSNERYSNPSLSSVDSVLFTGR